MSGEDDITSLLEQIKKTKDNIIERRTVVENELKKYKECRIQSQKSLDEWVVTSPSKLVEEKMMPPEEQYKMPPSFVVLKRVVQGRDWHYGRSELKEQKGVVFSAKMNGSITVRWDDGEKTHCRWGQDGFYDVLVVPPNFDQTPIPMSQQAGKPLSFIVGRRIKRGRDWKWSDQDGGNGKLGYAIASAGNGWICVRWDTGNVNQYRWGNENCYDVEVVY
ncbi:hypothetical protein EIN_226430 [Entamoeba invadens IP1]|uniref:MIB/HERC2 domain-containing protein n=1 Tax=Entamoeba invadens IP1 TaxID=370355 RepID=A0A0A1U5X1_ENTIV|nr:hypothetical protein EIN_226430 [Entamoeba invadens IP1]ELP88270.1 hypothetical protein EIN_226430 [Entamoeba invadens IP1]|eukprot:XP_004255041.1 hypothetical protein EIN_226430 [Entamoeba invadens IP1]